MGEQNPLASMGTPNAATSSAPAAGMAMTPTMTPLVGGSSGSDNPLAALLAGMSGGGGGGGGAGGSVLPNLPPFQLQRSGGGGGTGAGGSGAPKIPTQQDNTLQTALGAVGSIAGIVAAIASIASSEKLKTDVGPLPGSVDRVAKDVYKMPVKTWRYLWDEPGRTRVGPMLESMPEFMRQGDYHFDPVSMFGALVATMQSQHHRLRRLEGGRR